MRRPTVLIVLTVACVALLGSVAPVHAETYTGTVQVPGGSLNYVLTINGNTITYRASGIVNGQPCTITANAVITMPSRRQVCISGTVVVNCAGVNRTCQITQCGRNLQEAGRNFVNAALACLQGG